MSNIQENSPMVDNTANVSPQAVSQNAPEKHGKRPKKPATGRRVGTVTFGCVLIATGLFVLYALFHPDFPLLTVLKWTPVILVALGVEILLNYFFRKGQELRYDFLSGLICFLLVIGSLGAALSIPFYDAYGPTRDMAERQAEEQIFNLCYDKLQNSSEVAGMEIDVDLNRGGYDINTGYTDLEDGDKVHAAITLAEGFRNEAGFAAYAKDILEKMQEMPVIFDSVSFTGSQGDRAFTLEVRDRFQANLRVSDLTQLVEASDAS